MSTQPTSSSSPQVIKKMEKEILKEGKAEERNVKNAIQGLSNAEKSQTMAQKDAGKAERVVQKAEKKELAAVKVLNKATHKHDVALTHLHGAEKDAKMKAQQHVKLQKELDARKAQVDSVVKAQQGHNQAREAKMAELHSSDGVPVGMGQSAEPTTRIG